MKILKLIYNIDIEKSQGIRLFSNFFVEQNKKKCKIIIENKILSELIPIYDVKGKKGELKVKLLIFGSSLMNLKEMFYNCISLKECYFKERPKKSKTENNLKEEQKDSNKEYGVKEEQKKSKIDAYNIFKEFDEKYNNIYQEDNSDNYNESKIKLQSIFYYHFSLNEEFKDVHIYERTINHSVLEDSSEFNNNNIQNQIAAITEITDRNKIINETKSSIGINYFLDLIKEKNNKKDIINIEYIDYMFYGCLLLEYLPDISIFNTKNVTNMNHIFEGCLSLISLPDISKWDTNKVQTMSGLFDGCTSLITLPDLSKWNTNNVRIMSGMFYNCSSLKSLPDISKWNTNKVQNMSKIFYNCSSLISLPDISNWNTNNVRIMSGMFKECTSLLYLPDIYKWNIENVLFMDSIFYKCFSLMSLPDISKWKTNNVKTMSDLFNGCSSLISLPDISSWNTTNVEIMSAMFYGCSSLISLPDISKWNTKNVSFMDYMFDKCSSLYSFPNISKWNTNKLISKENMFYKVQYLINVPSVTFSNNQEINYIYKYSKKAQNLNDKLEEFCNNFQLIYYVDEDKLPPLSELSKISYFIRGDKIKIFGKDFVEKNKDNCIIIHDDKIYPLNEYFLTKDINRKKYKMLEIVLRELISVPDKSYMFDNCTLLKGFINFKSWREFCKYVIKGEKYIFYEDTNEFDAFNSRIKKYPIEQGLIIEKGKISRITKENIPLNNKEDINQFNIFDPSYIFDMSYMFHGCASLVDLPNMSNWETRFVNKMIGMFSGCSISKLPDISKWDISLCVIMSSMFEGCSCL